MKILLVNDIAAKFGGTEEHIYGLKDLLTLNGHVVEVFGPAKFDTKISKLTRLYNPLMYIKCVQKIRSFKPDIVHCHNLSRNISPSPLHAARKCKTPIVMTIHDYHLICPKTWLIDREGTACRYGFGRRCIYQNCHTFKRGYRYFPYQWLKIFKVFIHRNIISKNVDVFILPSAVLADWFKKNMHVKQVEVLPNFVQASEISPARLKDTKIILYVGRLSKEKGIEYLIRAMPMVRVKVPQAKLVIIGTGLDRVRLEKLVTNLNISEAVSFSGYIQHENLRRYYEDAEVVVIPSIWMESFGLVAIEALASGTPVIASGIGGLPELVQQGKTGYIVQPKNTDDLAGRVIEVLSNFELATEMSRSARQWAEESFSAEGYYKRLLRIYENVRKNV
jgi:glycosyltransferase involved in cell wall biosynthesis